MTTASISERDTPSPVSTGEDDVRQYLHEIRQYPRLTVQQERELARRCAQGDEEAIRVMVNSNLRLVVSIAGEYAGRGVPLMDLVQEGSIGLLVAARKFDYTLEYRFSTYATKWIRQGVSRCLMEHAGLIRVPLHTAERIRKVQLTQSVLRQQTGEEPTAAQIAAHCGIPEQQVRRLLNAAVQTCSLDAPVKDGEDDSLGALMEDEQAIQPQEELVRQELEQTIGHLLGMLSPRQRQVLQLHFGMEDGVCHTLEEIGAQLGVSKERARQIERQAMERLKKLGADIGLEDFLE